MNRLATTLEKNRSSEELGEGGLLHHCLLPLHHYLLLPLHHYTLLLGLLPCIYWTPNKDCLYFYTAVTIVLTTTLR